MSTANIIIPAKNAGIGDLVYGTRADHIIVARGTANAATINSKNIYGAIYGFVAGYAMVCAPEDLSGGKQWGTFATGTPTISGLPKMRNVKAHTYAQMNTARNATYITKDDVAQPTDGLLEKAYLSTPLTAATFATAANAETLKRFGSWDEYIRQTLRVNGVPGTPFGATTTGVKVHEFGRYMGMLCGPGSSVGTAMRDCYDYTGPSNTDPAGTWWLPSMFELAELMIDDHYDKLNENNNSGWSDITNSSDRGSCVCRSASYAWVYSGRGMSDYDGFTYALTIRPVTLLKL